MYLLCTLFLCVAAVFSACASAADEKTAENVPYTGFNHSTPSFNTKHKVTLIEETHMYQFFIVGDGLPTGYDKDDENWKGYVVRLFDNEGKYFGEMRGSGSSAGVENAPEFGIEFRCGAGNGYSCQYFNGVDKISENMGDILYAYMNPDPDDYSMVAVFYFENPEMGIEIRDLWDYSKVIKRFPLKDFNKQNVDPRVSLIDCRIDYAGDMLICIYFNDKDEAVYKEFKIIEH